MRPVIRVVLNFAVYGIFSAGLLSFVGLRGAKLTTQQVALGALCITVWCGGLSNAIELAVYPMRAWQRRVVLGATLGALSLAGFAIILATLAWGGVQPLFVGLAATAGAAMQGARAFAFGQTRAADTGDTGDNVASVRASAPPPQEPGLRKP